MDTCFWSSDNYWSTRNPKLKKNRSKTELKVAYLGKTGWFAFIFSKYNSKAVEVFRSVSKGEVWFYQEPINQFKSFSAWCIDAKHFESILSHLRSLSDIDIEFVVPTTRSSLCIPAPFRDMGLEFFEVGSVGRRPSKIRQPSTKDLSTEAKLEKMGQPSNKDLSTPTSNPKTRLPHFFVAELETPTGNPNTRLPDFTGFDEAP